MKKVDDWCLDSLLLTKLSYGINVAYLVEHEKETFFAFESEVHENFVQDQETILIAHKHGRN